MVGPENENGALSVDLSVKYETEKLFESENRWSILRTPWSRFSESTGALNNVFPLDASGVMFTMALAAGVPLARIAARSASVKTVPEFETPYTRRKPR